mmetsp:Transcript_23700/g.36603  ORF Transcript_23700/g.36603 Transcript_23700/m.36603 type:complete len:393 (+) Transcript_23700:149-1327(+)
MVSCRAFVAGSGVMGLRTALELLRKNIPVTLRSPRSPLHSSTCSQGAGGIWMPYSCNDSRIDRWSSETLDELLSLQQQQKQNNVMIETITKICLKESHGGPKVEDFISDEYQTKKGPLPQWTLDPRLNFQHLTVEMLGYQNHVFKLRIPSQQAMVDAGYKHAWVFNTPVVDTPKMLMNMLQEIESYEIADIDVETNHEYQSVEEMVEDAKNFNCNSVVNCAGLGARNICSDDAKNMVGARGIILHFDRKNCIRRTMSPEEEYLFQNDASISVGEGLWGSETEPAYVIPRGDILVVGGSFLKDDSTSEISPEERERLLWNANNLAGIDVTKSKPIGEWTGFRPYREAGIRCEVDQVYTGVTSDMKVVHNYGHGGSGWTTYVGAAKEVAQLLST